MDKKQQNKYQQQNIPFDKAKKEFENYIIGRKYADIKFKYPHRILINDKNILFANSFDSNRITIKVRDGIVLGVVYWG